MSNVAPVFYERKTDVPPSFIMMPSAIPKHIQAVPIQGVIANNTVNGTLRPTLSYKIRRSGAVDVPPAPGDGTEYKIMDLITLVQHDRVLAVACGTAEEYLEEVITTYTEPRYSTIPPLTLRNYIRNSILGLDLTDTPPVGDQKNRPKGFDVVRLQPLQDRRDAVGSFYVFIWHPAGTWGNSDGPLPDGVLILHYHNAVVQWHDCIKDTKGEPLTLEWFRAVMDRFLFFKRPASNPAFRGLWVDFYGHPSFSPPTTSTPKLPLPGSPLRSPVGLPLPASPPRSLPLPASLPRSSVIPPKGLLLPVPRTLGAGLPLPGGLRGDLPLPASPPRGLPLPASPPRGLPLPASPPRGSGVYVPLPPRQSHRLPNEY